MAVMEVSSETSIVGSENPGYNLEPKSTGCRKCVGIFLTNPGISVLLLVLGSGLSLGLGAYSIFREAEGDSIQIDKSFQAFAIPNHPASKRQDALSRAKSEYVEYYRNLHTGSGRRRRDTERFDEDCRGNKDSYVDFNKELLNYLYSFVKGNDNEEYIEVVPEDLSLQHVDISTRARRMKRSTFQDFVNDKLDETSSSDHLHSRTKRQLHKQQSFRKWRMELIYLARETSDTDNTQLNIFSANILETIHQVERQIVNFPKFQDFCFIDYQKKKTCAPLNSVLTYFYPSVSNGVLHYDSLGDTLQNINDTLTFAMQNKTFFWYVDSTMSDTNRKSKFLRSEVIFGAPLEGYSYTKQSMSEQSEKYKQFIVKYIDILSNATTSDVRVLYGSNELFDYQVDRAFWGDIQLALYAFCFILIFLFILTSFSLWLTFWGMWSISLSFPLALFIYKELFKISTLGILNGAAAFVIIGIGVDDVFVFINTFRQAEQFQEPSDRMLHTILNAGKATFFTSFTTAAAFAANVASSIPAVHEFGLFMSLIVSCCWIMVVILMPPAINIWRWLAPCEAILTKPCPNAGEDCCGRRLPDHDDIAHSGGMQPLSTTTSVASLPVETTPLSVSTISLQVPPIIPSYTTDDKLVIEKDGSCPIVFTAEANVDNINPSDVNLQAVASSNEEPATNPSSELPVSEPYEYVKQKEGCQLTAQLRILLYHFVARPVVYARWFVAGGFLVLLAVSLYFLLQLTPASNPRQLFAKDTNLQQMLDLAANTSDSGIRCDKCSGFYGAPGIDVDPSTTTILQTFMNTDPPTPVETTIKTRETTTKPTTVKPTTTKATTAKPTTAKPTTTKSNTTSLQPTVETTVKPTADEKTTQSQKPTTAEKTTIESTTVKSTTKATIPKKTTTEKTIVTQIFPFTTTTKPAVTRPTKAPKVTTTKQTKTTEGKSPSPNTYSPCDNGNCDNVQDRPNLGLGASVYVVFGIEDLDRSNVSRRLTSELGSVVYSTELQDGLGVNDFDIPTIEKLCLICKRIANNTELVVPGGSQCVYYHYYGGLPSAMRTYINKIPACQNLPEDKRIDGKNKAIAGWRDNKLWWMAMVFESTTYKGQSPFTAYKQYKKWEDFIDEIRDDPALNITEGSPLYSMYQTSEFWKDMMMEIVAVSSAGYGVVFSMIICVAAIAIFTSHILLLVVVVLTIGGVISTVMGIFYLAGWELGAVEAISLSILVGSSVDYCVHLVEGYLSAGKNPPATVALVNSDLRQWRSKAAVSNIGVSIISSAITTIIASIPLTQATIQPFAKFGQIIAINTTVSIVYTLTACTAFLAIIGPAHFKPSLKATVIALGVTIVVIGILVGSLYAVVRSGIQIPGPNGKDLFG